TQRSRASTTVTAHSAAASTVTSAGSTTAVSAVIDPCELRRAKRVAHRSLPHIKSAVDEADRELLHIGGGDDLEQERSETACRDRADRVFGCGHPAVAPMPDGEDDPPRVVEES